MTQRILQVFAVAYLCLVASQSTSFAWDPWKDITGRRLKDSVKQWGKDIQNAPGSLTRCVSNLDDCAEDQLRRIPYHFIWPVIERYKAHLFNQVGGRAQQLPLNFQNALQPHYPQIDLRTVVYASNINTIHGKAITWENYIFFPYEINLSNDDDLKTMLHELEHVVQYRLKGGYKNFISEYLLKAGGKIIQEQTFNPHDYIEMERGAESKANYVFPIAKQIMMSTMNGTAAFSAAQFRLPPMGMNCITTRGICPVNPAPFRSSCGCRDFSGNIDPGLVQ